jgi:hypothetical protein
MAKIRENAAGLSLLKMPLKLAAMFLMLIQTKRTFFGFAILLLMTLTAFAQPANRMSVDDLRTIRLADVTLDSVRHVKPDAQKDPRAAAHVEVKGIIGGRIRFELLLPDSWNGRFVMGGGGGFVGTVQNSARDSVNRGYATAGTDTGHQWPKGHMAGWAYTNVEAQVNFGFLAVHRTAEVAKELIRRYYSADSAYSYFVGCSRGGGQAMMEAQRYPKDFDGIVAGAPAFNWTGIAAAMTQIAKALYPDPRRLDHPVLDSAALEKLARGIIEQCDEQDGLKDGILEDPASAHFDLAKVTGLTEEQRKAIEAIYQGASNDKGPIYPGFAPVAECDPGQWIAWLVGPVPLLAADQVADLTFAFGTQILKYLVFNDPDWNYATYDFSRYEKDSRMAASFLNATDPNLEGLKGRGGKLIIWHGWADPALPAQGTIDYYRQAQVHDPNLAGYCRLFMVPGCLHCGGGPGASEVDWLGTIVDWVEHGKAPERIVAKKREQGAVTITRPLYPYPKHAAYDGAGDPKSAESFVAK